MKMDMSQEKEQKELLPEGWRTFKVIDVTEETSKAGNPMLKWIIKDEETGQDETIFAVSVQGKRWFLKGLLLACGVTVLDGEMYDFELSELKNKIISGEVKHIPEKWVNREGVEVTTPKAKIVNFKSEIPF